MRANKQTITAAVIAAFLLVSLAVGCYLLNQKPDVSETPAAATANANAPAKTSPTPKAGEIPIFSDMISSDDATPNGAASISVAQIIFRLFLAVVLAAVLAFRPRRNVPLFQRNLSVAQTQILLAMVAAALMMVVGDNAARAFAIFAAASLVRFRTNIRDPKEITVLLVSLALGLAAGFGRWDLGVALCIFALVLLWFLEMNESEVVFRPMELTVKTRNTDATQKTLKKLFNRYKLETEVRQIDPPDEENPIGCIMYYLNLRLNITTDYLSDRIFAADSNNIEGIQWEQKKEAAI